MDQNIVDKIRKVLALSNSPNENEAAAAAEKVQTMLAEYNLSLSDIKDEDDSADESIVIDSGDVTTALPWRRPLALAVAKMYFCDYFYTTVPYTKTNDGAGNVKYSKQASDIHNFVGAVHNVAVARVMFMYLNETIDRLAKEGALKVPPKERSPYRTTFRGTCAQRVCYRIAQRMEAGKRGEIKTETGSNLPALLDLYQSWNNRNTAHIKEAVGELITKKSTMAVLHDTAVVDGYKAGDRIGLDQQVGKDKMARISR